MLVQMDSWTGRKIANSLIDKELRKVRPKRSASWAVFILDNVCFFFTFKAVYSKKGRYVFI